MNYQEIIKKHIDIRTLNQDDYMRLQHICEDIRNETFKKVGISPHEYEQFKNAFPTALKLIRWINFLFKALVLLLTALLFVVMISLGNKAKAQTLAKSGPLSHVIWDDDAKHYWAGFTIAGITTDAVYKKTNSYGKAFLAGFVMANIAGWGKEFIWDGYMHRGVKNMVDGAFTGYGGLCGSGVVDIVHHFKETRRAEEIENSKHLMD